MTGSGLRTRSDFQGGHGILPEAAPHTNIEVTGGSPGPGGEARQ